MESRQFCGSCCACVSSHGLSQCAVNPQCHRRHLRPLPVTFQSLARPTRSLRRVSRANSQHTCLKRSSVVTNLTRTVRAERVPEGQSADPPSGKVQGFSGLGAQRTLDFLAAWDQLALRLPPQAGMGKAAELILNALKLEVSHLPPPSDPLQATPTASRTLSVATQLADLSGQGFPLDSESIAAGILVDAVAAQRLSLGLVDARLGSPVANLIEDVLKVRRLPSRVDLYDDVASSSLRELALTFYDTRAIVVGVVARLVGMGTLVGTPLYARQLAALEALQIYAPMGHGLGLRPLCAQLEDRCFQELFPESYAETAAWLRREVNANGDSLARCEEELQQAVEQDPEFQALAAGCQVAGRTKSLFSTMKKLLRLDSIEAGGRARQEVHDILASRCIVTPHPDLPAAQAEDLATQACYVVARVATQMYEETVGRRKDYIAHPKDNGYQSLHCTIKLLPVTVECEGSEGLGPAGTGPEECVLQQGPTCELQIRTQRMHELADSGDAAHAAYKGGLDALQANRLQSWTHTLRALPPATPLDQHRPQEWSNQAAAAEQLFSHLDRNGDGYISVEEVGMLLEELGVDAGVSEAERQGQGQLQETERGAGQLLDALADKQHSGVTFAEFLRYNSQASLLGALPRVDTETAQNLRRSTSASPSASPEALPPVSAASTSTPSDVIQAVHSHDDRLSSDSAFENELASSGALSLGSTSESSSSDAAPGLQAGSRHGTHSGQTRNHDGHDQQEPTHSCSASTSYLSVLSIPHTSRAQSLAVSPLCEASTLNTTPFTTSSSRSAGHSSSAVACYCSSSSSQAYSSQATSTTHASSSTSHLPSSMSSGHGRMQRWSHRQGRAAGHLAAACCGGGPHMSHMATAKRHHSSWRLHAVESGHTTAETADSEVVELPHNSSENQSSAERRSSHDQASSSSGSSLDLESSSNDSPPLSTKHDESTLSLDLSGLPVSLSHLPKPRPTTRQPDSQPNQSSPQQSAPNQARDTSALLSTIHNESTISLDLDDLPYPPSLVRPPRRPSPVSSQDPQQLQSRSPSTSAPLDWDNLSPQSQSPARSGNGVGSRKDSLSGSWDNLQPLFRPPPRVEPPKEPQEPLNDAAAADLMFSAIQSKRYRHEKGTSYNDATFALVPIDRKVGWRLQCDDEVTVAQPIHLPQHGPLLLGGGDPRQGACDIVLEGAVEAGPGVHARLEVFFKGRKPCCLVTCLRPYGTTFLNKVKLPRMVDTEVYLGDILSFGELTMAFQFVPVLVPERQQSALENALHYVKTHANGQRLPKRYDIVSESVRQLSRSGNLAGARVLMANSLVKEPVNSEGWAQLANTERRMSSGRMKDASIPAARCYYRAAAELIQEKLDANASPNGEAAAGSQQYKLLMKAVNSFIRVVSSWAQMEYDIRNDTSARRLYRRALDAVPKDPPLTGAELQQPVKLLFKWAHQEYKNDNLFQGRELLQTLLQLEPESTRGLGMLGALEWKAGKPKLARQYLLAAIKADPSHVANLHTLARLELEEGHLQEARELFAEGQKLEPDNAYVLQSWALAEAGAGDTELARDMLQKATVVQPRSVPCWHAWAKLEMTNGNADKARELYLKALELDPTETFTHSALGALERKCGNLELALSYLDKALELTPRHPAACVEKAIVLRKQGKPGAADRFTEKAIRETTQLEYKRGTHDKPANQFVRSSEPQQEDRRQRQQKEAQGQAKKAAATQKGSKTVVNRMRRKRRKQKADQAKKKAEAEAQAPIQEGTWTERVVTTPDEAVHQTVSPSN